MLLYNNEPNLTIILPVNCNAHCQFCFWHKRTISKDYIENLKNNINKLNQSQFKMVSISGGEPTLLNIDVFQDLLLFLRSRFTKIVLNTNGYKLKKFLTNPTIRNNIDYINVSRHAISDIENNLIFKTNTIPTTQELFEINRIKPIRLNCVFKDNINYNEWVMYCKEINIDSIAFRRLANKGVNKKSLLEKTLDKDKTVKNIFKSKCKVCYSALYNKDNIDITIRYSVDEPIGDMKKNTIFELITDGEGNMNHSWDNNNSTRITDFNFKHKRLILDILLTKLYYKLYKEVI